MPNPQSPLQDSDSSLHALSSLQPSRSPVASKPNLAGQFLADGDLLSVARENLWHVQQDHPSPTPSPSTESTTDVREWALLCGLPKQMVMPWCKHGFVSASRSEGRRRTRQNCSIGAVLIVGAGSGMYKENPAANQVLLSLTRRETKNKAKLFNCYSVNCRCWEGVVQGESIDQSSTVTVNLNNSATLKKFNK